MAQPSNAGKGASRVRLDARIIVDAGLELAQIPGTSAISVRDLGTRLGADPTAIYRHFRSKDALMAALLDELNGRAVASVNVPLDDWQGRLRQLAERTLHWYTTYPAIGAEALTLTTHGPGESAAIELMLEALQRAGLEGEELVRHYALLASHTLGLAAGIARAHTVSDGIGSAGPWIDSPLLADPRQFPLLAQHSLMLSELQDRDLFLMGVDTLIESARRTAEGAR